MAAVLKHWREAATLIIVAPSRLHPATFSRTRRLKQVGLENSDKRHDTDQRVCDSEYETLLLKRSGKSKFMPNVYVFPGGTAVNDDFSPEWLSVFEKLGKDFQKAMFEKVTQGSKKAPPMFTRQREPQYSRIPPEVAFRICAIRETFEESGILIVKPVNEMKNNESSFLSEEWNSCSCPSANENILTEWRKRVNENPNEFLLMCKEMDLIPDILSLYEWTNWLTPTLMGGKRFDTIFYICCLDEKPKTKEDSFETVDYQWISPSALLSAHFNQHGLQLAPPQVYELSRLLNFNEAVELMDFAAKREAERVERFFPVIVFSKDYMISLLPGDGLYPENPDLYTPKQMIQYDETLEEMNKRTKFFNRSLSVRNKDKGADYEGLKFNIVFKNKHIGPVTNFNWSYVTNTHKL